MSNKRIVKNSIFLYVRLVVTMFVGILTSRYVLGALGASDYGLYSVVGGIVGMMAFINTIMVTSTYRFIAYEQGKPDGDVNSVFNVSLSLHIAAGAIVLLLAGTAGVFYISNYLVIEPGKLGDAYFVFVFSVVNVIVHILGTPFQGLLVANEKFAITVPIEIFTKVLVLAVAIVLNFIPYNHLRIYAVLITIVHSLNPLAYAIYCLKTTPSTVKWRFQRSKQQYSAMLKFTGWNMIEVSALMGEHQGSAIVINRFFGTLLNASFGVSRQVNSIVRMFARSLSQAIVPQITKSYSSGDTDRSFRLVVLSSKYSYFLMLIPMLPIMVETDFILNLWLKEVPQFTKIFIQGMLLKSLISTSQSGLAQLIDATGNIKYFKIAISGVTLLPLPLAIIAYNLGYPPYTISYIYLATAAINFVVTQTLLSVIIKFKTREFLRRSTLPILIVSISMLPLLFIQRLLPYGFLRFGFSLIFSEILLLLSIAFLGMEKLERRSVYRYATQTVISFIRKARHAR